MTSVDRWAPWHWARVSRLCMMAAAVADMPTPVLGGLPAAATAAATLPRMTDGVLGAIGRAAAACSDAARRRLRLARLRDVAEVGDSLRLLCSLSRRFVGAASFWPRRGMFRTAAAGGVARSLDACCVAASMVTGHERITMWKPVKNVRLSTPQPRPNNPGATLYASPRYLLWLPAASTTVYVRTVRSEQRRRGASKRAGPAGDAAALPRSERYLGAVVAGSKLLVVAGAAALIAAFAVDSA